MGKETGTLVQFASLVLTRRDESFDAARSWELVNLRTDGWMESA